MCSVGDCYHLVLPAVCAYILNGSNILFMIPSSLTSLILRLWHNCGVQVSICIIQKHMNSQGTMMIRHSQAAIVLLSIAVMIGITFLTFGGSDRTYQWQLQTMLHFSNGPPGALASKYCFCSILIIVHNTRVHMQI